jgi:hypothetical protein
LKWLLIFLNSLIKTRREEAWLQLDVDRII